MRFNLTPTITIETAAELEEALKSLTASGADSEWVDHLRHRASQFVNRAVTAALRLTAANERD